MRASSTCVLTCVSLCQFKELARRSRRHASLTPREDARRPGTACVHLSLVVTTSRSTTTTTLTLTLPLRSALRRASSPSPLFSRANPARLPRRMRARPHVVDAVRFRDSAGRGIYLLSKWTHYWTSIPRFLSFRDLVASFFLLLFWLNSLNRRCVFAETRCMVEEDSRTGRNSRGVIPVEYGSTI